MNTTPQPFTPVFAPITDKILLARDQKIAATDAGIIIPETAREEVALGTVLAVGPGAVNHQGVRIPLVVRPGDRVLFRKYAGVDVELDGPDGKKTTYLVLTESEMLGIVGTEPDAKT